MSSKPFPLSLLLSLALLSTTTSFLSASCKGPPARVYAVKMDPNNEDLKETQDDPDPAESELEEDSKSSGESEPEDSIEDIASGSKSVDGKLPEADKPKEPGLGTAQPTEPKPTEPKPIESKPIEPKPPETKPIGPVPSVECTNKPSVSRIHQWHATNEGIMVPSSGLIVVKEGDKNVAKVEFIGEGWHVVPVWLKNAYESEVDLSKSKNFTITYSATADLYVQLRPAFAWSGGDKWAAKIPSTGGAVKTLSVSFDDPAAWIALLGPVPHTLAQARAKARGFVFVGNKPTKFVVSALVIDGYIPPCE